LRERLRCKEIWVVGADKWRNPDEDLPADFDGHRVEHYAALRKPIDASEFIDQLRHEMRTELDALQVALPKLAWLDIRDRGNQGAIKLTDFDAAPEPRNLRRLKNHVRTRWGPGSKQHKINDWLPCPGVVLPGLVGCLDPA
jgi:Transposase.